MTDLKKIEALKELVFAQSNQHCFVERERYLNSLTVPEEKPEGYYADLVAGILDFVSTPIEDCDTFVGRVVEGPPEGDAPCPNRTLFAKGHITPDYQKLLEKGYCGILDEIRANAARLGTPAAASYARNAEIVIKAVGRFAQRYAAAAAAAGKHRAAGALSRVPLQPAYDLFSALQCIWLMHMIASCYVGSRDYGFGYMDEYLYPYYQMEKEKGTTDREIVLMLASFFVKPNEICGRHPHNYRQKPVLSHSAKQYVLLDGGKANHLSELILEASRISCMAQPIFTVILSENAPERFGQAVFDTMSVTTDKLQVYNCQLLKGFLRAKHMPDEIVERPAFTACCTADIYRHTCREEFYLPTAQLFCDVLYHHKFADKEAFLAAFGAAVTKACEDYLSESRYPEADWCRKVFVLDTLLLSTCNENCDYPPYGSKYRAKNIFLPGMATLGDSLCALDRLVFRGQISYERMMAALRADFEGYEDVYAEICACPKFGNDTDADCYTVAVADTMIGAVERAEHLPQEIVLPSLYSLERNNVWAPEIPATPDGRRSGQPISENQSPVYGADRKGMTALLNSLAKLPFERTAGGGLNLTFSAPVRGDILKALAKAYFEKGGLHMGITVLDRQTLKDAMVHPEKYRSLTVRLYGFSEYFVTLPEWQQLAVLERTAYEV
ncbi:MAG: hypothetical protein IJY50_06770 [Clostridia bacterium]|nr:hypothetical protein [Clostridia bacterium]